MDDARAAHPSDVRGLAAPAAVADVLHAFTPLSGPVDVAPRTLALVHNSTPGDATKTVSAKTALTAPAVATTDGLTEAAHAERFAKAYGDRYRFDHRRGCWLRWDRTRWREDVKGQRYEDAVDLARALYLDAQREGNLQQRAAIAQWAIRAENRRRIENVLALASHFPPLADAGDQWDTDPWLLNTPNGVVDLRTGTIHDATPEDKLTYRTRAMYDPTATCPRWEQFLAEVFADHLELGPFVQKAVGYSLTGRTGEQCLFLLSGTGANGKGTLLNTLVDVLGDYAHVMQFSTLLLQQMPSVSNDLAALVGKRFVIAQETTEGRRFDESKVKALTGSDPISARFLYHEPFTFTPMAHFWLAVNHKPDVRDDSYAFWRRMRLIPFTQTFPGNLTLADALLTELDGILRWAVEGCLAWQAEGLLAPVVVQDATGEYQQASDRLAAFLEDACDLTMGNEVGAAELYEHYRQWADRQGLTDRDRLTATAFGRKMAERFRRVRVGSGKLYQGIGRRPLAEVLR